MSSTTAASVDGEPKVAAMLAQPGPHAHLVELHDDDERLYDRVAQFVAAGLRAGEPALVVARAALREALARRLTALGIDAGAATADAADPLRELAALEQRARALEHELAQRTQVEAALRDALAREQRAREEAERAVRFNEMFASMLGHDLRNPLGAISMGASYIARSSTNEKITRSATRILTSTERMTRMVEQLLDFSRIRAGRALPLHPLQVDLAGLCARVKDELEAAHPECAIALEQEGSAMGEWDYERLLRVLSTVVGNAVSHGAAGEGVTIRLDGKAAERVTATVHNAGAIPPETLAVLFEPFRGPGRQHHTQGLGLGLFISLHIVRAHGGTLEASSSEADGTTLQLGLPRSGPAAAQAGGGEP